MGVWATGLYSGDFALDLRSTIAAVAKLPFDNDRLVDILCESEAAAARNPNDTDHATFWLVVADQFAKRGIQSDRAQKTALQIIDSGSDLQTLEKLGMKAPDLRKRKKVLEEVRQRILSPQIRSTPREVLKAPQTLLMHTGDVLVYPTFGGRCRNPYFVDQNKDRMGTATPSWQPDSWSAMVIVDSGRAFDFLAWYRPLTLIHAVAEKPTLYPLQEERLWCLARPGTSTSSHFKRMGIEKIGAVAIDREKLTKCLGEMRPGISAAVSDISLANQLSVGPYSSKARLGEPGNLASIKPGRPFPTILGLRQILADA
ncbi:hypothetical protein P8935_06145 [Telmatobacter sp. DSM 110680]|uniref:Uncharacterized protein n=1 Tax=Telmatobacter sp. DSM 110680 TaxID=3036704 RepID=A0AAU7DM64_9BACT